MEREHNSYRLTDHARRRAQQRAISNSIIEFVLDHGETFHDRFGSMTSWLSRRALWRLPKPLQSLASDWRGIAVSLSDAGEVITVQRVAKIKRDWRGAR